MVKKTNAGDSVDLDAILVEMGQFGVYQILTIFLLLFPVMFSAFASADYLFTATDLTYRCHIPECEGNAETAEFSPSWISIAIPEGRKCERFAPRTGQGAASCSANQFDRNQIIPCESYVYNETNTIVYDFGMHCEDWKRTLIGTLRSVGTLIVLPFTGFISDRYGRRTALIINAFNTGLFGFIRSWSTSYEMFLALSMIETSVGAGAYSSCFILATELLGPNWRSLGGVIMSSGFAVGQMLLGLLAWAFPEWRTLLRVLFAPQFIVLTYFWILAESVRWLLSKGKFQRAEDTLKRAAKLNGTQLSAKSLEKLSNAMSSMDDVSDEKESLLAPKPNLFMQVIKSKIIFRRICTTPVWWITSTLVYYGLSINSVGLAGNRYVNFILVSAVEIPGYFCAFFALNFIGRKITLSTAFIGSAVANFIFPFIPEELPWLSLTTFLVGKFFISVAMTSNYVYTSELFPTESRHSLLAFSSMIGRIGSIVAPQTPLLIPIWAPFPTTIFGTMGVISGLLVLTTPETMGTKMPDTIEEAERIGSNRMITIR